MGLIIVKESGSSATEFLRAVHATRNTISASHFSIVTIKKGMRIFVHRSSRAKNDLLPGMDGIKDQDISVVTFSNEKSNSYDGWPHINLPAVFAFDLHGVSYTDYGNMFISSATRTNFCYNNNKTIDFNEYCEKVVDSPEFLSKLVHSKFEEAVKTGFPVSPGIRAVFGNQHGIYIHGRKYFYEKDGLLFSVPFLARRILEEAPQTTLPSKNKVDEPVMCKHTGYRSSYYREKREVAARKHDIFFTSKYNYGTDFKDREKFVLLPNKTLSDDKALLLSLKTGEIIEVLAMSLNTVYTPFLIKRLHNDSG